jgi:hypothetical protein
MNLNLLNLRQIFSLALAVLFLTGLTFQSEAQNLLPIKGERPPIDLSMVPEDAFEPGVVLIKFHEEYSSRLETNPPGIFAAGEVRFFISTLDDLIERYSVNDVVQHFSSPAFRNGFTDRHKAWGFHLWYKLRFDGPVNLKMVINQLLSLDEIEIAEPEYKKILIGNETMIPLEEGIVPANNPSPLWTPNDPQFNNQWHYHNTGQVSGTPGADIDLIDAWNLEKGNSDVIVAIVDDGIQFNHPDISGNMWSGIGYNFVTGSSTIQPGNHGTHVAGTVAAVNNNGIGVSGVAGGSGSNDGVRLMSCQVFSGNGNGGFHLAPVWAADNGASISQNSWGYTSVGVYEQSVLDAIDYFNANGGGNAMPGGGITIFAAGNSNAAGAWYPGFYSGAFAVAATTNQDVRSYYSNYGTWIDVSAPGGETNSVNARGVLSTVTNSNYAYYQGTSMACPHVSGVAALIISHAYGQLTPDDVADIIRTSADDHYGVNPGFIGQLGTGRLNAHQALIETQAYLSGIPNPVSFAANTLSASEISLSWVKNADNHDVLMAWSPDNSFGIPDSLVSFQSGDTLPGGGYVLYTGSGTDFNHTGLTSSTPYFYRAWSYTNTFHYSSGRPASAITSCEIFQLPFDEDFENVQGIPLCWTQENVAGSANWNFGAGNGGSNPANAFSGSSNVYFKEQALGSSGYTTRLVSPEMNIENFDTVELRFWYTNQMRTFLVWNLQDILRIKYKTTATADWQLLETYDSNVANWTEVVLQLPNLSSTYYIAFEAESGLGHGVCIDKVTIEGEGGLIIHTIQAFAGENGTIDPSGPVSVIETEDQEFSIVANEGFVIESLLVDGFTVPEAAGLDTFLYTFSNVTQDHTIMADFEIKIYSVEAIIDPEGAGVVEGTGNYAHSEAVELLAVPLYGFEFENWTENGEIVSTSNYLIFEALADRTLSANFGFSTWNIVVTIDPEGSGTVEGGGDHQHLDQVELTAVPEDEYAFTGWFENGELLASENPFAFVAIGNRDLTAHFQLTNSSVATTKQVVLNVFPNPSTGKFRIDLNEPGSIMISDLAGIVLFSGEAMKGINEIDITARSSAGIYFLHVESENAKEILKIVVE